MSKKLNRLVEQCIALHPEVTFEERVKILMNYSEEVGIQFTYFPMTNTYSFMFDGDYVELWEDEEGKHSILKLY